MSLEQAVAYALEPRTERAALAAADEGGLGPSPSVGEGTSLTAREVDVLRLVAEGYTDQEVAGRLGLRPRTVTSYLTSIYGKLGVRTRTAAVRRARDHQLI